MPSISRRRGAFNLVVTALATVLLLASCSPDLIEVVVEPESAESCDDLVPTGAALAVQLVAAIETVPIEVLTGDAAADGTFGELLAIGRQFDAKSQSLSCDPVALNVSIMEEVGDEIEPGSLAGTLLWEIMQGVAPPEPVATTVAP